MKKVAILLSLGIFLTVSCEKREQEPQVSTVSFTPCQQTKARNDVSDRVDVEFTNGGVQITYSNFMVTCDFTTVNVTHTFVNGVLNITQQGSPNQAKCICHTDVSYTINGISQNEVNVIFINGEQVYCYNDIDPDEGGECSDDKFLELAYDKTYLYPNGFYQEPTSPEGYIYYVNTVSISPINQRDTKWIELSTNDKNEALIWVKLTMSNSNVRISYSPIEENETNKYFEFKSIQSYDGGLYPSIMLFRVHKKNYYHSILDKFVWGLSWMDLEQLAPNTLSYDVGHYNANLNQSDVKEFIEYLWIIDTFSPPNQKVISSKIEEKKDYFEVHICSLQITYGDWGIRDYIRIFDNYIRLNKNNRLISFEQSFQKKILGQQR